MTKPELDFLTHRLTEELEEALEAIEEELDDFSKVKKIVIDLEKDTFQFMIDTA